MRVLTRYLISAAAVATTILSATVTDAANVRYMDLRDLVARADRIARGKVIDAKEETIAAGGGQLPIVTYRIRIAESLKGVAAAGDVIEVRLLANAKPHASGRYQRGTFLRDLPEFQVGRDYLFVLTKPSAIGLSTTVGLSQGLFQLRGLPGQELAVNGANNLGLFNSVSSAPKAAGPVAYDVLAKQIRALVAR